MLVAGCFLLQPLRRPEASIEHSILRGTPLGSSFDDALHYIAGHDWKVGYADRERGFLRQDPGTPGVVVGDQSIRAHLGYYRSPLRVDVTAFWGFDASGRLTHVWVWKTVDAP
jgi:hypothetical protein